MAANDPSALLGLSPDDIQSLLAYFQPSQQDKSQAMNQGLLSLGATLMQGKKGHVADALGQGLLGAQGSYNTELQRLGAQRGQNLTQALALRNAAQTAKMQQYGMVLMNGDQGSQQPAPTPDPSMQQAPQPFDLSNGPTGQQAPQPFAPPSAPPGTPMSAYIPNWRQTVPKEQVGMALASGDYKKVADVIGEGSKINVGREGTLTVGNTIVGRMLPEGGALLYQGGDMSKPVFFADPQSAVNASANYKATTAGAIEKAKTPYQTIQVPVSTGGTVPQTLSTFLANQQPGAAPQAAPTAPAAPTLAAPVAGAAPDQPAKPYLGTIPPYKAPVSVIGTPQTTQSAAYAAAQGKNSVEVINDINNRGSVAASNAANYDAMQTLADQVGKTGVTTPMLVQAGKIALALGVNPDTVKSITEENVPAAEAFGKLLSISAGQSVKANVSSSSPTQFEFGNFLENTPNLAMTQPGRNAAMKIMQGSAAHARAEQQAANDWMQSHNNDISGFQAWFDSTNPPSQYFPTVKELQGIVSPQKAATAQPVNRTAIGMTILNAQKAIKAGADPVAVKQRMQAAGIPTDGL